MVQANLEFGRRTVAEAVAESNRYWITTFNLERPMTEDNVDFDELLSFVEVITRDKQALIALGSRWDAR